MTASHVSYCAAMCELNMTGMYVHCMACYNVCGKGVWGGGTPYSLSVLTYGGGVECVHLERERKWEG